MNRFEPDIIAINETWLPEGQEARAPVAPGYRLRNKPRPRHICGGRGGGVAFYFKRDIRVRFLNHPENNIEQMWLSIRVNGHRIIIGTAYRPQWLKIDTFIDALTESVSHFSNFKYMVLLGDFNVNMLDKSSIGFVKIDQFLRYLNLEQVVKDPTHTSVSSETLIDLVCTNCKIRDVTVDNITGSLGHSMVNISLNLKKTKVLPSFVTYRPMNKINIDQFNRDLIVLNWESVSKMSSVNSMVDKFNFLLLSLFDQHAPLVTTKFKHATPLPWITDVIKLMIQLRNKAHNKYRKSGSETHKNYYKELKKLVSKSIESEKRAYYNHFVNLNVNSGKKFWKNIKEKIITDSDKNECLSNKFKDPNLINNHFLDVPGPDSVPISNLSYFENFRYTSNSFFLRPVSENDVVRYINTVKSNCIGSDGITRDMILFTLPHTLPIITAIVNESILKGIVPNQWKIALITPISKVTQPNDLKDLRPINILPF
ncbi:uncharacterized protein LOC131843024 [Achroia grisella]|nr:uncharacterized protein LOC131843024 [Achroia grisella]